MPYTTLIHSAPLMASKLPCSAMAAPVRPAISEWLWLVGMPKYQATVPHTMMATMAAMRAMSDCWESPPKSTILNMVCATAAVNRETTSSPRKLQTAAMTMAGFGFIALVDTTVAIAFGASVAPFTTMTPMLSRVTTTRTGLDASPAMNEAHSMVTKSLSTTTAKRFSIPQFNVNLTKRKGLFSLFTLDYGRNGKIQVKSRPGTAYR